MNRALQFRLPVLAVAVLAASGLVLAQTRPVQPQQSSGGWRRVSDPPPVAQPVPPGTDPEPVDRSDSYGQPAQTDRAPVAADQQSRTNDRPPAAMNQEPPARDDRLAYGLPSILTLKPGTFVTVRTNQGLSSDRNQPGDSFSATLAQPVVVDGVVVAQRGQTLYGRVAEVERQHSNRPSRLGLELTEMTLADGSQVPIRSQLVARQGGRTPAGDQAGTVIGTTAVGAAIGAAADWGTGAAVGGGIGAAVGLAAVMLTRNHATEVYPETALTFRIEQPVEISTARAPQAFRYVGPEDYNQPYQEARLQPRPPVRPCYGCAPPIYYGPSWYPYYWGTGVYIGIGPRYGYYGYGRRVYRRWR